MSFGANAALSVSARFVPALRALMAEAPSASCSVLNVGCGQSSSVLDLNVAVGMATGKPLDAELAASRLRDSKHSPNSIDRSRAQLSNEPVTRFEVGIGKPYRALLGD